MDRCVKDVMAQGKDKDKAIAICYTSIMGKLDTIINSNIQGGEKPVTKKQKVKKVEVKVEDIKKDEEVVVETKVEENPVEEPKVEEPIKEEPKTEEPVKEEKPKTEEPTKTEEPVAPVTEEPVKEEPKVEEKVETAQVVKIDTSALEETLAKVVKRLSVVSKRISKVAKSIKTPAEGAPVEEQPKVEVKKIKKVKTPKEEVKVEKTDTSSGEVSKAILSELKDLKERLLKLENSPAPSKVIMSKSYLLEDDDEPKAALEKIEKRLSELDEIRKASPVAFTDALQNEAFSLINKRDAILGK